MRWLAAARKDSGDGVLYADGSLVKGPKALCELQGYVYAAWRGMAEIYAARGEAGRASALNRRAAELFNRFNEVFWDDGAGFYAFALDGDKRQVLSVASNVGHCLWSGIVAAVSFKIVDLVIGLRVTEEEEREGLDISSHGETAYSK